MEKTDIQKWCKVLVEDIESELKRVGLELGSEYNGSELSLNDKEDVLRLSSGYLNELEDVVKNSKQEIGKEILDSYEKAKMSILSFEKAVSRERASKKDL